MTQRRRLTHRRALANMAFAAAGSMIPWSGASVACGARRQRALVLNPYQGIDWQAVGRYKAALHTHTLQSDGYQPVAEVVHVGERLDYRETPGIGSYVRAELLRHEGDHTHRTFTNPFGLTESPVS